jgi:hypothetical protein
MINLVNWYGFFAFWDIFSAHYIAKLKDLPHLASVRTTMT